MLYSRSKLETMEHLDKAIEWLDEESSKKASTAAVFFNI